MKVSLFGCCQKVGIPQKYSWKLFKNWDFHSFLSDKDEVRSISSLDDHSEEGSSSTDLKHEQDDEKEEEVSSNHFF